MSDFFIYIYRFFRKRRMVFISFLILLAALLIYAAGRIKFEEDISQSVSGSGPADKTAFVVKNLKTADKLIVDLSLRDTASPVNPDLLESFGQALTDSLNARFGREYIRNITFRASDSAMLGMMDMVMDHLPSFLDEKDYRALDSILQPGAIREAVAKDYRILLSPASMVLKKRIGRDPLGISNFALAKLKSLRASGNFDLYHGCIVTGDLRHMLLFIDPANPSSETRYNEKLIAGLDQILQHAGGGSFPQVRARYFGGIAVAVCNARQLKADIILTLVIALILIFILTGWYFRSIWVPVMGLLPALFGGMLAIALLFLAKGRISAISLGIGSVILGLIVDYVLYLVTQFRRNGSVEKTLRDMSLTIVLCSLTSAGAFLCLTFLNSTVLHDLGWFAAISVTGAALFALVVIPQFMELCISEKETFRKQNFIDRLASVRFEKSYLLAFILLVTGVAALFFTGKVKFEKNMAALSYMTPELASAEADLDRISSYKLKSIYLVATGRDLESTLRKQENLWGRVTDLKSRGVIHEISNAGPLLISDSTQRERIRRWHQFWGAVRIAQVKKEIAAAAKLSGFQPDAFEPFTRMIGGNFTPLSYSQDDPGRNPVVSEWLTMKDGMVMALSILKVNERDKGQVYRAFPGDPGYVLFDRQSLAGKFVENVRHDFDLLVTLSMIFVTLLLVFSFGRMGLGLLTALPMFFSWLLTLGFMGITGIRFNIFNIIISSFIFGLGVDYSILMMRGLQHSLKSGLDEMHPYKVSVLLSSLTTLFGVGALFFARHPALNSIALISVFGIVSVVIIAFVFPSMIFDAFILSRCRKQKFPVTLRILVKTMLTWGNIVLIAVLLMTAGTVIKLLIPLKRRHKKMLFHHLFRFLTDAYIAVTFAFDRKIINEPGEDFTRPAVIISNHQSLIETPAFLRLHPKIIILTASWVYRSPIFGPIARLADYFNVDHGIDSIISRLREKVDEGFSVLIFPEAHRSYDQHIQRFHRGAFYLAEQLQVDILPVVVFGTGDFLAKGEFWGKPNSFRMKILDRIPFDDHSFGSTYKERAKNIRKFYTAQYAELKAEEGTACYYRRKLALNYVLKGPVLEWYMRVKMKLEDNYDVYARTMPRSGEILDLGCGYGFISYMLLFTGDDRRVTGIDYDPEKIGIAASCFSKNDRISFACADVSDYPVTPKAGFVLGDVLHYLTPDRQGDLLRKCFSNLLPGGVVMIREANAALEERHKKSKMTEFLSTRIGFNKTRTPEKKLYFTTAEKIASVASEFGLTMETLDNKKITSNNLFIIRK